MTDFRRVAGGQVHERPQFRYRRQLIIVVVGAILGGFLFRLVGLAAIGLLGSLTSATVGAIVLLFILRKLRK